MVSRSRRLTALLSFGFRDRVVTQKAARESVRDKYISMLRNTITFQTMRVELCGNCLCLSVSSWQYIRAQSQLHKEMVFPVRLRATPYHSTSMLDFTSALALNGSKSPQPYLGKVFPEEWRLLRSMACRLWLRCWVKCFATVKVPVHKKRKICQLVYITRRI